MTDFLKPRSLPPTEPPIADGVRFPIAQSADETAAELAAGNPFDDDQPGIPPISTPGPLSRRQFRLSRVQILILVICIASAGMGALMQTTSDQEDFLFISLALVVVPGAIMTGIGLYIGLREAYSGWQHDKQLWRDASSSTENDTTQGSENG